MNLGEDGQSHSQAPGREETEGKRLLDQCRALFEDDKLFQAVRAERALALLDHELHVREDDFLSKVRAAGDEAMQARTDLQAGEDWTLVREGSHEGDCWVWYRPETGTAIHSLRVSADIEAPLEYLLVLLNEVHLFNQWLPFIGESRTLLRFQRCAQFAWIKVKSPAALLLHHRDACLECRAIDGLDEDGCVLVIIKSDEPTERGPHYECPDGGDRTVRVDVKKGAIRLEPLKNGGTRITAVFNVDPKLQRLPAWLINCVAQKLCYVGMWQFDRHARRIARGTEDCAHRRAIRDNADFYDWVIGRVQACVPKVFATSYFGGAEATEVESLETHAAAAGANLRGVAEI